MEILTAEMLSGVAFAAGIGMFIASIVFYIRFCKSLKDLDGYEVHTEHAEKKQKRKKEDHAARRIEKRKVTKKRKQQPDTAAGSEDYGDAPTGVLAGWKASGKSVSYEKYESNGDRGGHYIMEDSGAEDFRSGTSEKDEDGSLPTGILKSKKHGTGRKEAQRKIADTDEEDDGSSATGLLGEIQDREYNREDETSDDADGAAATGLLYAVPGKKKRKTLKVQKDPYGMDETEVNETYGREETDPYTEKTAHIYENISGAGTDTEKDKANNLLKDNRNEEKNNPLGEIAIYDNENYSEGEGSVTGLLIGGHNEVDIREIVDPNRKDAPIEDFIYMIKKTVRLTTEDPADNV